MNLFSARAAVAVLALSMAPAVQAKWLDCEARVHLKPQKTEIKNVKMAAQCQPFCGLFSFQEEWNSSICKSWTAQNEKSDPGIDPDVHGVFRSE